jgi:solute:Na+ symporter, SSS family
MARTGREMTMLLGFVILYWVISVGIGLWAALRVKNTADFALAGRGLPFHIVTATVFATWFGSETVLGIPATFLKEGLSGVISDPFGSSLCLILVGLFFARPLYRMKLMTIGDFYHNRYGRAAEVMTTLCIVISYLGWVGAQIKALGLVFNVVSDGVITQTTGMLIGTASILVYTLFGGMWAVAVTDFVQMIVIVIGMLFIGGVVADKAGGVSTVIEHAQHAGMFNFWPEPHYAAIFGFIAALITMMLGSIPQQDVFQRVTSSKTEKIAGTASILGGILYFGFAFVPLFLAYSATLIAPDLVRQYLDDDPQMILPKLVLLHAPLFAQILFFGALLSAIKSCASATLLAPSVTFAENILRPMFPKIADEKFLRVMQMVVLFFTGLVLSYALASDLPIFNMVENAYKVTLVTSFIPLSCGLFWKQATKQGALLAIVGGGISWVIAEIYFSDAEIAPQLIGLFVSAIGMLMGSLLPQWISNERNIRPVHLSDKK